MKDILFTSFESLPFIKTGGLADVVYALPKAINKKKFNVKVCLPLLKKIKEKYIYDMESIGHIYVNSGQINEEANILKYVNEGIEYLFIENDTFFYRDGVYGYDDDAKRYSFFNIAVIEMMISLNYYPDIIHSHDYHTGLISALCKLRYSSIEKIKKIKHIFTIHNLAYQGVYDKQVLFDYLRFDWYDYESGGLRCNDAANFMKIGITYADCVSTVSNTYANEIQTPDFGERLDSLLRYRKQDLVGIVNGIDTVSFDPEKDEMIYRNYSLKAYKRNKRLCKRSLQYELGLKDDPNCLLVGIVSRLTFQKGMNLVLDELQHILNMNVQLVVLGTGETNYEYAFKMMEENYKHQAVYYCGYNEALAHKIYAGTDLFLMPSKFEPCGISQLIAMRYGSLPLVRETGGLKDTVLPYNAYDKTGRGFSFTNFNSYDFKQVFNLAYDTYYNNKKDWNMLVKNAMEYDVSFKKSAIDYENVYDWMLQK